jgi:FkbM family methyltransferase
VNTVFDVGAHSGGWAREALQINSEIDLHCFEPSQSSFHALRNRGLGKNVTHNNFGLGSGNSQAVLHGFEGSGEGNSLYIRRGLEGREGFSPQNRTEEVEIRTLSSYCDEKNIEEIDFLKIDVEGHELAVIQGGKEIFERGGVKIVQFEYGGCYIDSRILLRDFYEFFDEMNYSFFLLYPSRIWHIPRYDQRLENFQYKTFLIVNYRMIEGKRVFPIISTLFDDYE